MTTPEDVQAMPAGAELDALVASALGFPRCAETFQPSGDWRSAGIALCRLRISLAPNGGPEGRALEWEASCLVRTGQRVRKALGSALSPELAVARCAALAGLLLADVRGDAAVRDRALEQPDLWD